MTPEQQEEQAAIVAEVAVHYGRLSGEGRVDVALVSNELVWALDRLRDHYLQVRADGLE